MISLVVISQDGEKNNFSIGKLILSIARSFNHNEKLAGSYSYDLANTIQDKLIHLQKQTSYIITTHRRNNPLNITEFRPNSRTAIRSTT